MTDKEISPEVEEMLEEAAEAYRKHHSLENKVEYNGARGNVQVNGFTEEGQGSNF